MAETFSQQALGKMLAYSDSANVMVTASRRCSPVASQDSSVRTTSGTCEPHESSFHAELGVSNAGALSAYAAVSKVEADLSDELAIRELVLSTTSFRDVKRRSLTVRLPATHHPLTARWACCASWRTTHAGAATCRCPAAARQQVLYAECSAATMLRGRQQVLQRS